MNISIDDIMLSESFDMAEGNGYPVLNLMPQNKIPQVFAIKAPDTNIVLYISSANDNKFNKFKTVKTGDKVLQVWFCGIKAGTVKMQVEKFNGKLGKNPLVTLSTAFDAVMGVANMIKADAILFRFHKMDTKGKGEMVARIMNRLIDKRSKGKFKALVELQDGYVKSSKWDLVMAVRKSADLASVKGIPHIDLDLFGEVKTKLGTVYIDKSTGKEVTKATALAGTIAKVADGANPQANLKRIKISRRAVISSQYFDDVDNLDLNGETKTLLKDKYGNEPEVKVDSSTPTATLKEIKITDTFDDVNTQALNDLSADARKFPNMSPRDRTQAFLDTLSDSTSHLLKQAVQETISSLCYTVDRSGKKVDGYKDAITKTQNVITRFLDLKKQFAKDEISQEDMFKKMALLINDNISHKPTVVSIVTSLCQDISVDKRIISKYTKSLEEFKQDGLDGKEIESIRDYCTDYYDRVNDFLLGKGDASPTAVRIVDSLDSIIKEKGVKLPKGTTLFRGMGEVSPRLLQTTLDNKVFYFKNFVSTSMLMDSILGGFADTHASLLGTTNDNLDLSDEAKESDINLGFIIKGVENTKAIIPGSYSEYPHEAEVILPRGTALQINGITESLKVEGYYESKNSILLDTLIMNPDQLDESIKVYDGDALLESGELVEMKTPRRRLIDMLNESDVKLQEKEKPTLASLSKLSPSRDKVAHDVLESVFDNTVKYGLINSKFM